MRISAFVFLTLIFSTTAVCAASEGGYDYSSVSKVPCSGFIALRNTDLFDVLRDPVVQHVSNDPRGGALGSGCNIADYVYKTCAAHPKLTIGEAVVDLFSKVRSHAALPLIGQCGA